MHVRNGMSIHIEPLNNIVAASDTLWPLYAIKFARPNFFCVIWYVMVNGAGPEAKIIWRPFYQYSENKAKTNKTCQSQFRFRNERFSL